MAFTRFSIPLVDKRLQSEEAVRAGELAGGIGHALLVLQEQDLLRREVRSPPAQCVVIEPSGDRVLICLNREPSAVAALVGKP